MEGQTVSALLDTRSPVTVLLLNFIVNSLVQLKKENQTKEQWKDKMKRWQQEPSLVLNIYGGNKLTIVKETLISLRAITIVAQHCCCSRRILLMHNLLSGTDSLSSLGFQVIQKSLSKESVDLLTDKKVEGYMSS